MKFALLLAASAALVTALTACTSMEVAAAEYVADLPRISPPSAGDLISEDDLAPLPDPVARYFRYAGVVGKPRPTSVALTMTGVMKRTPDGDWMPISMRQFSSLTDPSRVFYIEASRAPMKGIDSYIAGEGRMQIRVLGLFTAGDVTGPEMDASGLVTFLNDLVLYPPAYFSLPVSWSPISDNQAALHLTHRGTTVTATFTFDEIGRLQNWESDDRYAYVGGVQLQDRWSTPILEYGERNGLRIPVRGSAVHDYDGTPWTYIEFELGPDVLVDTVGLPL